MTPQQKSPSITDLVVGHRLGQPRKAQQQPQAGFDRRVDPLAHEVRRFFSSYPTGQRRVARSRTQPLDGAQLTPHHVIAHDHKVNQRDQGGKFSKHPLGR